MSEPILCEYLLKLATDSHARERFTNLSYDDRMTFLATLGLHEGPANALATLDDAGIAAAVAVELQPRGASANMPHHTIQMKIQIAADLTATDE